MHIVYVPFSGDLYEIHLDPHGKVSRVYVRRDNCSRPPVPLDVEELPVEVAERLVDALLRREHRHH
jgi:hypothetical protein